jgi:diphosphomevalonate decarboxylase
MENKLQAQWQSPSNIALVKYWGKKENQIPANISVSFTLKDCNTTTTLIAVPKSNGAFISVVLNGVPTPTFAPKIEQFFHTIAPQLPFINDYNWEIETHNTFPHSSGIASSASGMSALALCLLSIAAQLGIATPDFMQSASTLSRLGSGSACRSIYGPCTVWGKHPNYIDSSDLYAVEVHDINTIFKTFCDTILIVHAGQKSVSSSIGHNMVNANPFAASRFAWANQQAASLKPILKNGDIPAFIEIVESEALMLHALMMSSSPGFMLMKPNTLAIIEKIRDYRKQNNNSFVFTLDAGANVHFMYSKQDEKDALAFIQSDLVGLCDEGRYICDAVGNGPKQI